MEICLTSPVASPAHSISFIGAGGFPTLLENQNASTCKSNYNSIASNGVIGIGHSILNLLGTSTDRCKKDEVKVLTTSDEYSLASLTLKNALNVNNDNANKSGFQKLIETKTNKAQKLQCNSSEKTLQTQQNNGLENIWNDLAALKRAKTTTSNKLTKNKQTTSSNASKPSSTSPSSTSASTSIAVTTLTTNSSSTTKTSVVLETPVKSTNPVATVVVNGTKNGLQIPSDILDDLASRFIINVPDMELSNFIRICFQIELAHWFYLDFFCASEQQQQSDESGKKRKLPSCGIKQFATQIFQHIPFLREHLSSIDKILDDWKNYKLSVPTFGAILISEDLNFCLLVQSYFAKSSWGFPKGKVNENEDPVHCATREVFEETGYDITKLIVPNDYIEAVINYQYTRLYIVRDVSLDTQFSPRTRNEIKCCDWFPIDSLPVNKNDAISKAKLGINANSFFMIMPFVKRLKKWVHDKRSGIETRRKHSGGGGSNSPISVNSPTTLMTTAAVATAAAVVGGTRNCNNQKHTNTNSSSKKNKQHSNNNEDDKHNALKSNSGNTLNSGNNSGVTEVATNNNSNRSKRQRHKSMGDLDGIKLNNLSSNICNSNNNCKNMSKTMTTASECVESTTESIGILVEESGNCKTVYCHKRNGSSVKIVAAGSSSNVQNSTHNSGAGFTLIKHQSLHSQNQNGNNQNGEKIVSSFDLIRKEKQQQMKAAAQAEKVAKSQKQQQQMQSNAGNNGGRVRAKSQGDKMCVQQPNANKNNNNNGGNNKHRVQKQISIIIVDNSNTTTNNDNKSIHNNNNTINSSSSNSSNNSNNNTATINSRVASNPSPSSSSGAELLAFAAEAANLSSATNSAQKPRPASVALHCATPPTPAAGQAIQQLQRMASGTNLRMGILKRSNSHQPQPQLQQQQQQQSQLQSKSNSIQPLQQQQQQQQQQALFEHTHQLESDQELRQAPLKFTPSFNSWTNFSFTKNFIANVFC